MMNLPVASSADVRQVILSVTLYADKHWCATDSVGERVKPVNIIL
jgi:hypothetical protein